MKMSEGNDNNAKAASGSEDNDKDKKADKDDDKADKKSEGSDKKDDVWTYYEDATWKDDYKGFKSKIKKVAISDKAPAADGSDEEQSAVGVQMKLNNTTKDKFTTYPDQAELVTSTGEQLDAEMFLSDKLGGEYDEGVKKHGGVYWYLKDGKAKDIKWIKLKWNIHKGAEDEIESPDKDYEVKLKLDK